MLFLKRIYDFLIYIFFTIFFPKTMIENYEYVCVSEEESMEECYKEIEKNTKTPCVARKMEDSILLKQFQEKLEIDLSTEMSVLEKMERLWFVFSQKLTEEEKIDIANIVISYGVYPYWSISSEETSELRIELFSLEKLEEIRSKRIPATSLDTFRRIEEDDEEFNHQPPPKKEERKPNYWYRSNENFKKADQPKNSDGWSTVGKRK